MSFTSVVKVLALQLQQQSFQWMSRVHFLKDCLVWSPLCRQDSHQQLQTHSIPSKQCQWDEPFYLATFSHQFQARIWLVLFGSHAHHWTNLCGQGVGSSDDWPACVICWPLWQGQSCDWQSYHAHMALKEFPRGTQQRTMGRHVGHIALTSPVYCQRLHWEATYELVLKAGQDFTRGKPGGQREQVWTSVTLENNWAESYKLNLSPFHQIHILKPNPHWEDM